MLAHHESTLNRAVAFFQEDPNVLAVLLGGSIVKGLEKPASDVDVMVVVTAEEFARRRQARQYAQVFGDLADYEGGYVDAKFVDEAFLLAAAERGSEPTRDSFKGVRPVWSKIFGLEELVARIPIYPEHERDEKIRRFYSQALVQIFFVKEAEKRNDLFLMRHATTQMALFAARLILAYNRVLFPSNKRLMERVAEVPSRPEGFIDAVHELLASPSESAARAFIDRLNAFHDLGIPWPVALGQYVEDSEFNWLENPPPLAES